MNRTRRLKRLEEAHEEWQANHIPLAHVVHFFGDVLDIVAREAGDEAARSVAGRVITARVQRVEALQGHPRGGRP